MNPPALIQNETLRAAKGSIGLAKFLTEASPNQFGHLSAACPLWVKSGPWLLFDHLVGAREQCSQDPTLWMPSRAFIDFIVGIDALLRSPPYHIVYRPNLRGGVGVFQFVRGK